MGNMQNMAGYVKGPLMNVNQSVYSIERNQICYIEYDTLVKNPRESLIEIYKFLEEPWFEHDFDNIVGDYDEFDADMNIKGLHHVRQKVQYKERQTILPLDLFNHLEQMDFWKHLK